jgi:hypothetical protein
MLEARYYRYFNYFGNVTVELYQIKMNKSRNSIDFSTLLSLLKNVIDDI